MKHIKSNEERHTNDSEIAVFWYEMERNLPKSLEMEALGKEKIFRAFSAAYPNIKDFFLTQREADQRALVKGALEILKKYHCGHHVKLTNYLHTHI